MEISVSDLEILFSGLVSDLDKTQERFRVPDMKEVLYGYV